jgi:hypothetical protein
VAEVTVYTAERMQDIEDNAIVNGEIDGSGNLILTTNGGTDINAGPVISAAGTPFVGQYTTAGRPSATGLTGKLYWDIDDSVFMISTGSTWEDADLGGGVGVGISDGDKGDIVVSTTVVEGDTWTLETVPIAKGGTGATGAPAARTNLGLGTAAVANTGTASGEVPTNANLKTLTQGDGIDLDESTPGTVVISALTPPPNIQTFDYTGSTQTWTNPGVASGRVFAMITCIAGGGGGSTGVRDAAGTIRFGGAGGGPGMRSDAIIALADLSATEDVVVGVGGTGGALNNTNGANGNAGGNGGNSTFGTGTAKVTATGGGGAPAGANSNTYGGGINTGTVTKRGSGRVNDGAFSRTDAAPTAPFGGHAGGGGAGGGINGGDTGRAGGSAAGGVGAGGGAPGLAGANNGSPGGTGIGTGGGGGGGGGGAANAGSNPGAGGVGGTPGGGGGGSGASANTDTGSPVAGAGGPGRVIVVCF